MNNKFQFSISFANRVSVMFVTLLVIIGSGCIYYFFYLKEREADLDKLYFRKIENTRSSIETAIKGYFSMAEGQALAAIQHKKDNTNFSTDSIKSLLSDKAVPWKKEFSGLKLHNLVINDFDRSREDYNYYKNMCGDTCWYSKLSRDKKDFTIQLNYTFHLGKPDSLNCKDTNEVLQTVNFSFTIPFDTVLKFARRNIEFDGTIITYNDEIVFDTYPTDLTTIRFDSVFSVQKSAIYNPRVPQLDLAGNAFRCYVVPVKLGGETGWNVIGLKSRDSFRNEKNQVPRSIRFFAFIIILASLLALPFIKSLVMSRTERLQMKDVIFSIVSMVVSISLIALILFDTYLNKRKDRTEIKNGLSEFSRLIENDLKTELDTIRTILTDYSAYTKSVYSKRKNKRDSIAESDSIQKNWQGKHFYKNLFVLDDDGNTQLDLIDADYSFNVSARTYFKGIKNRTFYFLNNDNHKKIILEPIMSWREGKFRAAVSIPPPGADSFFIKNAKYKSTDSIKIIGAVLTTDLETFRKPVMPAGSGLCLVDSKGNVLFHSQTDKSLRENFIEECRDNPSVAAAVSGRESVFLRTEYGPGEIYADIRPLKGTPFTIVSYENAHARDSRHGQVFGGASFWQILLLLVYGFISMVIYVMSRYQKRLRIPRFSFAFFMPSFHEPIYYFKVALHAIAQIILLLVVGFIMHSPMLNIFCILSSPFFIVGFCYLFAKDSKIFHTRSRKKLFAVGLVILITATELITYKMLGKIDFGYYLAYQIVSVGIYFAIDRVKKPVTGIMRKTKSAYRMVLFLNACLISIVPICSFAAMTYNNELLIETRYMQLYMKEQFIARENQQSFSYNARQAGDFSEAFFKTRINKKTSSIPDSSAKGDTDNGTYFFQKAASLIRPFIQNTYPSNRFYRNYTADGSWDWSVADTNRFELNIHSNYILQNTDRKGLTVSSEIPYFSLFKFKSGWSELLISLVFIIFMLIVLYQLLGHFVRRLFATAVYKKSFGELDKKFIREKDSEYRLFVTGLPCSGKSDYFNTTYGPDTHTIDLINCSAHEGWLQGILAKMENLSGTLIVDHFEYDCLNAEVNRIKLGLLEHLAQKKRLRVVIISTIHPQAFLELYMIPGTTEQKITTGTEQTADRWIKVLSNYYNIWFPISGIDPGEINKFRDSVKRIDLPPIVEETIISECSNGHFLRKIGDELCLHYADKTEEDKLRTPHYRAESIILKIQQMAHSYYLSIWSQLTHEEQYVLFDLAQDNLVNTKNMDTIDTLVKKGLIRFDKMLVLMNKSFQNFILTVIEPADLMKVEQSVRENGNWNFFKKPLMLIVLALIIFIWQSDSNIIFTYITGFAAILPILINVLGSLKRQRKTNE